MYVCMSVGISDIGIYVCIDDCMYLVCMYLRTCCVCM